MNGGIWSFYILLVTFMGISPGGARESSPWREPWEQTRTARSPGGAKEPFHGDSPIAGHEGPSYAPTGLARLWAGLFSSVPSGASNRARTRLARREELGIKAQTRVENVETPDAPMNGGGPEGTPAWKAALQVADQRHVAGGVEGELGLAAGDRDALAFLHAALLVGHPDAKLFHLRGQASDGGRAPAAVVDDVQRIDAFGDIAQGGAGDAGTIAFDGQGKGSRRSAGELLEIPEALGGTERAVIVED